jgi:hypothetical protein
MADPIFDNSQAVKEGWSIFDCAGSDNGRWQLQKCDDKNEFLTDLQAWDFVREKAAAGSLYHALTLLFLKQHNQCEWDMIMSRHGEIA